MSRSCLSSAPISRQLNPAGRPPATKSAQTSAISDTTTVPETDGVGPPRAGSSDSTPASLMKTDGGEMSSGDFSVSAGSLLTVLDLNLTDVGHILERATLLEREDPLKRMLRLQKRRIALLFYESSTRTRTSFELAAKGLGADTTLVSSLSSSIEKGESLKDTGITLRALGAECIILRHLSSGAPWLLARSTGLPVLNAGDGMHEHPSQALLDLRTILAHLAPGRGPGSGLIVASSTGGTAAGSWPIDENTLKGLTVTIVGDIRHSRVARSNALLLPRLGARVLFCGPRELLPDVATEIAPGIEIERDFTAALRQSQVVMMLRIQAERLAGLELDLEEYKSSYQANAERIAAHAPDALILHPGPMIRGLEITSEVADGPYSAIAEQVRHGVAIRMALVDRALASEWPANKGSQMADPVTGLIKRGRGRPKKLVHALGEIGGGD
jgi:aspartate carbamoyltransferase catalytic subunit